MLVHFIYKKKEKDIPEARDTSASRAPFVIVECYGASGGRCCHFGGDWMGQGGGRVQVDVF